METITIPLDLLDETMSKLGALPTKDGFGVIYEKLRYEKIKFVMAETAAKENAKKDKAQAAELTKKLRATATKTATGEKLKPLALAREFVNNNPTATPTDVKNFLISKGAPARTAQSTSHKVFKKS